MIWQTLKKLIDYENILYETILLSINQTRKNRCTNEIIINATDLFKYALLSCA